MLAVTLQGCDIPHIDGYVTSSHFELGTHRQGAWRMKPSYWEEHSFRDAQAGANFFNSCADSDISIVEVCGGHGHCEPFDRNNIENPILYCKCNDEWAGVECTVRRKRQSIAWFLSLWLGFLAADQIYLGWGDVALTKLILIIIGSAVGAGAPAVGASIVMLVWVYDVVRIGMGPVLSTNHRVQEDLPRPTFAVLTVLFFCFLAMAAGVASMYKTVLTRRRRWDEMTCYSSTKASGF